MDNVEEHFRNAIFWGYLNLPAAVASLVHRSSFCTLNYQGEKSRYTQPNSDSHHEQFLPLMNL